MFKLIVFVCLCATLAFAGYISPNYPECAFHFYYKTENNAHLSGHYYGLYVAENFKYYKVVYDNGNSEFMRCDIRNPEVSSECYVKIINPESSEHCKETSAPGSYPMETMPYSPSQFDFDETQYPEPADCPDTNFTGCKRYCTPEDACIIVDANGFFVQMPDGSNFTFFDPPSMDVFEGTGCDGKTPLPDPVNFCEVSKWIGPVKPNCSYHIKIIRGLLIPAQEYYVVKQSANQDLPLLVKKIQGDNYDLIRCDEDKDNTLQCWKKTVNGGQCSQSHVSAESFSLPWPSWMMYDSLHYPQPTECPDGTQDCLLYCEDVSEFKCALVDAEGHFLRYGFSNYTFLEPPTMDVFKDTDCDGNEIPEPPDYCAVLETIEPKFPDDCLFNISCEVTPNYKRDVPSSYVIDFYGIRVDGEFVALAVYQKPFNSMTIRCDAKNGGMFCYGKQFTLFSCNEDRLNPYSLSSIVNSFIELPTAITYNSSEYPVDAPCPNGVDECKKYCSLSGDCVLVNSEGYFVQNARGENFTYSGDFSMDAFEITSCSNSSEIVLPAPSADICTGGQTSSSATSESASSTHPASGSSGSPASGSSTHPASGSSTHPASGSSTHPASGSSTHPASGSSGSPAPASSATSAEVSSASVVKSTFTLFVVAIALALL